MSPANNTDSDTESILKERSCINIINNRGPTTDSWGNPCFNATQSEKILLVSLGDFASSLLSVN